MTKTCINCYSEIDIRASRCSACTSFTGPQSITTNTNYYSAEPISSSVLAITIIIFLLISTIK